MGLGDQVGLQCCVPHEDRSSHPRPSVSCDLKHLGEFGRRPRCWGCCFFFLLLCPSTSLHGGRASPSPCLAAGTIFLTSQWIPGSLLKHARLHKFLEQSLSSSAPRPEQGLRRVLIRCGHPAGTRPDDALPEAGAVRWYLETKIQP